MYFKKSHFLELLKDNGFNPEHFDNFERLSDKAVLFSTGEKLLIFYVNTLVFYKDKNKIVLNTNSWKTVTTKKWINRGFDIVDKNAFVFQRDFDFYLNNNGQVKEFIDNMRV